MYLLPLKAISRVWGRFNELEIPMVLRVPGFKLYSWIFGVECAFRISHHRSISANPTVVSLRWQSPTFECIPIWQRSSIER